VHFPCFLAGTRIQTASGLVAVEKLCIGDVVLTASGEAKPIKWIGKQIASSEAPVKIAKFAMDGKAPLRDLYVSPRHAIYIYPVHVRTRKFSGSMTRKLSVTESRNLSQVCGAFSRRKVSTSPAKSRELW